MTEITEGEEEERQKREYENENRGVRLVEDYLTARGAELGFVKGRTSDSYLMWVNGDWWEIPLDELGDSGGGGALTATLRAFLDAHLRRK